MMAAPISACSMESEPTGADQVSPMRWPCRHSRHISHLARLILAWITQSRRPRLRQLHVRHHYSKPHMLSMVRVIWLVHTGGASQMGALHAERYRTGPCDQTTDKTRCRPAPKHVKANTCTATAVTVPLKVVTHRSPQKQIKV